MQRVRGDIFNVAEADKLRKKGEVARLGGRSGASMSRQELLVFVGYLDVLVTLNAEACQALEKKYGVPDTRGSSKEPIQGTSVPSAGNATTPP